MPMLMHPRPTAETSRPLFPSRLCSMLCSPNEKELACSELDAGRELKTLFLDCRPSVNLQLRSKQYGGNENESAQSSSHGTRVSLQRHPYPRSRTGLHYRS